jgi:small ligand-binding sensory domain FIST
VQTPSRFASALSRHADAAVATGEVVGQVLEAVGSAPDLAVLFATGSHRDVLEDVVQACQALLAPGTLIGTTASGVLAGAEEAEEGPGLALWAGRVGPVTALRLDTLPGDPPLVVGLPAELAGGSTLVVLADPFSFDVDGLVAALDERDPGIRLVGGLASAGRRPGENRLVLDDTVHDDGAVAVLLPPQAAVAGAVSQGCRPLGLPWVVTASEGRFVLELGGRPALERLSQLLGSLDPDERQLASRGLQLGVVAREVGVDEFGPGDFLVRSVLGADRARGAVAVADVVEVGRVVQFHVRDARSADADLHRALEGVAGEGALLFTCTARGTSLFGVPNHDAAVISEAVTPALAGMFCAAELGPIGGRNAVHGFTASVVTFR